MANIMALYQLQQFDNEIQQGKSRLVEVVNAQKESAELVALRQMVGENGEQVAELQKMIRQVEGEVADIALGIRQSETRLYSGNVRNPKELHDLQLKIESLNRRHAEVEDALLEKMVDLEEIMGIRAGNQLQLEEMESAWSIRLAQLQTEQTEWVATVNELLVQRKKHAGTIPSDTLTQYETQRKKQRNGIAVAGLQDNRCQMCRVLVSSQKVQRAEDGQFAYCGNCGRLIVPIYQ